MTRAGRVLGCLLGLLGAAEALRTPSADLSLRASFGGAVLQGRVTAGADDELSGIWSGSGRARLLRCTPRCEAVAAIPVTGTLRLGADTPYRVALAGEFRAGQRVGLVLRFRQSLLNVEAVVARP
ncbi:hypothetical protein [Deinococcus budaensis]|uniref:Uncharacterized protein n=1 Tax=Deinococcus budaensis TaxID=1665626 RepID=A0A7W8LQU2_9DEIO|nr:hypothetical protein [Deinococcus budaensis]MBB5235099.1 hypothetical protein [Deinococcus budaensis]